MSEIQKLEPQNEIQNLFQELLGNEEGLRNSQQAVLEKQSNVRLFERNIEETLDKIKMAMGESNEYQFLYQGMVVDFHYPKPRISVDILNVDALPETFVRTKIIKEPNKIAIKEFLDTGAQVNWASLKLSKPKLQYKLLKQH